MHKGCLHHQVVARYESLFYHKYSFEEKNCNSGRLVPIAHGARVFKNFRRSIINITLFFPYLRAILVDFQSFWKRFNRLPWKLYCLHFIFCFRRLVTSFRNTGDTLRIHTQRCFGKFRSVKRNKRRFAGPWKRDIEKKERNRQHFITSSSLWLAPVKRISPVR